MRHGPHLRTTAPAARWPAQRAIGAELTRHTSVRDPAGDAKLAVLACRAHAAPQTAVRQTWWIRVSPAGALARRKHPGVGPEFGTGALARDPHPAGMNWARPRARRTWCLG